MNQFGTIVQSPSMAVTHERSNSDPSIVVVTRANSFDVATSKDRTLLKPAVATFDLAGFAATSSSSSTEEPAPSSSKDDFDTIRDPLVWHSYAMSLPGVFFVSLFRLFFWFSFLCFCLWVVLLCLLTLSLSLSLTSLTLPPWPP
jgi:hypothetical protein